MIHQNSGRLLVLKKKSSGISQTMVLDDSKASSLPEICDLFRVRFASVYTNNNLLHSQSDNHCSHCSISIIRLKDIYVLNALMNLKVSSGTGLDDIPSVLLVKCAESLCLPLTTLFN